MLSDCESLVKAIFSTKGATYKRTDVQVQSIRDDVMNIEIRSVKHLDGKINPADIFTKDCDVNMRRIVQEMLTTGLLNLVNVKTLKKPNKAINKVKDKAEEDDA